MAERNGELIGSCCCGGLDYRQTADWGRLVGAVESSMVESAIQGASVGSGRGEVGWLLRRNGRCRV